MCEGESERSRFGKACWKVDVGLVGVGVCIRRGGF